MKKTVIIIVAVIVAIVMLLLAGVVGLLVGYNEGKEEGFSSGYDIGYDTGIAKLTGDVWLVEATEKTIDIVDEYLEKKIDAAEACEKIEVAASRYLGDDTKLKTGCGEFLRNGIYIMYMNIYLSTYGIASQEEVADYNAQTLKVRNDMAKHLGIAER